MCNWTLSAIICSFKELGHRNKEDKKKKKIYIEQKRNFWIQEMPCDTQIVVWKTFGMIFPEKLSKHNLTKTNQLQSSDLFEYLEFFFMKPAL